MHSRFVRVLLLVTGFSTPGCQEFPGTPPAGAPSSRHEFRQEHMGTEFRILVHDPSRERAAKAAGLAFERIEELDAIYSDYRSESELSRLSRSSGGGAAVKVSEDLWQILERAGEIARTTGGAFDITVGPAVLLWRQATYTRRLPEPRKLERARARIGHEKVRLDPDRREVLLEVRAMRLDLGAIAKGRACDEALAVLFREGIRSALVDGGGDLVLGEPPPGGEGWQVEIAGLEDSEDRERIESFLEELRPAPVGVATSGNASRSVEIDGKRYSHIVDPRTALGLTHQAQVTVIAPSGMDADALASAMSVLGPRDYEPVARRLATELDFLAVIFVEDGRIETSFLKPPAPNPKSP